MPRSYVRIPGSTPPPYAFSFDLGYLTFSHVEAYVEGEVDGNGDQIFRTPSLVTEGTLNIDGDPLAADDWLIIQRTVPKSTLIHAFANRSSLTKQNLDEVLTQILMAFHEILDGRLDDLTPFQDALTNAITAGDAATGATQSETAAQASADAAAASAAAAAASAVAADQSEQDVLDAIAQGIIDAGLQYKEALVSESAPTIDGSLKDSIYWFQPSTARSFVLYNDGNSRQWVLSSDPAQAINHQLIVREEYAAGTAWGNGSAGENDRILNTVQLNSIPGASVNTTTGVVTLPTGKYEFEARAPAATSGAAKHRLIWWNVTDGGATHVGAPIAIGGEGLDGNESVVSNYFEIDAQKDFKVVQWMSGAMALGAVANSGHPEVGASLRIRKLYG